MQYWTLFVVLAGCNMQVQQIEAEAGKEKDSSVAYDWVEKPAIVDLGVERAIGSNDTFFLPGETIQRVSINSLGTQGDKKSTSPVVSADGRFVAFVSEATNLVVDDTNAQRDVFVFDRKTKTTTRASVDGAGQLVGPSLAPSISGDGQAVAFLYLYENNKLLLRDLATDTTTNINTYANGEAGTGLRFDCSPKLSANGRYVAFFSYDTFVGNDTDRKSDVFLVDRSAGTIELVSVDIDGFQGFGSTPSISGDGDLVAFDGGTIGPDNIAQAQIYVYDRSQNVRERVDLGFEGSLGVNDFQLAAGGRKVVMVTNRTVTPDIVSYELGTATMAAVNLDSSSKPMQWASEPSISADARFVAFVLNPQGGGEETIYVRDMEKGVTSELSTSSNGEVCNGPSGEPEISNDGRFVVFSSEASNLVEGDSNGVSDIFVALVPHTNP